MQQSRRALALVVLSWLVATLALTGGAASAESAGTPAEGRTVRVGTEGTYPPFTFHDPDTDKLTGFDIEVIRGRRRRGRAGTSSSSRRRSTRSSRRSTPAGST